MFDLREPLKAGGKWLVALKEEEPGKILLCIFLARSYLRFDVIE